MVKNLLKLKPKSAYNSLIIGPRRLGFKKKPWTGSLLMGSNLTWGSSFKVKRGKPKLKVLVTRLLLVLEYWDVKQIYRKSWPGSLLIWSDFDLSLEVNSV